MQKSEKSFLILTAFLILGIALAIQFRSTLDTKRQKAASVLGVERLRTEIEAENKTDKELRLLIDENLKKKDEYLKSFIEGKNDDKLGQQWDDLRLKAGLTDVEGPGLIIKLDDALARKAEDPRLLIIHDSDIRIILNDLKKAGAQAISINGERLGPVSEQVCAGPTIRINKNRYAVPYIINVIGNPDELYDSLQYSERVSLMVKDNIRIDIKKSDKVLVPKFAENPEKFIYRLEVLNK